MKGRRLLFAILACVSCSGPPLSQPTNFPTTTSCYPTPPPGPSSFTVTVTPDPVWLGIGFRSGRLDGPLVPDTARQRMTVQATGLVFGSVNRIDRVLRDRETQAVLGEKLRTGPFLAAGNTPCRGIDPLLAGGRQEFLFNDDLGFAGRSATERTEVTITDAHGVTSTVTAFSSWEYLPPPSVRSPMRTIVKQNDPASGCAFDPVHGYGLLVNVTWDPPPGAVPVTHYYVDIIDGNGNDVTGRATSTSPTSARAVNCGAHVAGGSSEHGHVGVAAGILSSGAVSAWSVADFDFQSCREAGTPGCQ
jgi:hypothetical protein